MSSDSRWNARPGWFKASFSGGSDNCLEVNPDRTEVGIRDSKDGGAGQVLVVSRPTFAAFINAARAGTFTSKLAERASSSLVSLTLSR